jgi:hypothetical protein
LRQVTSTTPHRQTKNTSFPATSNGSSRQKYRMTPRTVAASIVTVGAIVVALVYTLVPHIIIENGHPSGRGGTPPSIATSTPTLAPTPSPPSVLTTAPMDGSQVSILTPVQGTAQNIPKDEELWLFIVPSNQTTYFPQSGPIKILGGKWFTSASFGGANDVGLSFWLIPVLINQHNGEAHDKITKYFQQPGPVYKGIPRTSGMQLMLPGITVVR